MPQSVIAGRYRLDHLLGRGGMSEVWCADDDDLGRRVAIKLLAPDADHARFEREARAFASLAHPNITQVYDYGEDGGRPFMVLEYLSGGTLEDRLAAGGPLPDEDAFAIAAGIAAGLAHAHARGVVHRDLKPENVLFDEEGRPKLADFGIARMAAREGTLTEAGTVLGTASYISPEQASGAPATPASDVYSFGVIVYRLLTGRLPFESSDPLELVRLHRDEPPPPVATLRGDAPTTLEAITSAALAKDPRDRPRDGTAVLRALGVLPVAQTRALPVAAHAVEAARNAASGGQGPAPPARRSRAPLVAAAIAVLALAGAALAYAVTRSSSSPGDTGTFAPVTLPSQSESTVTTASTASTTTAAPTTSVSTTTAPTTTPATTQQTSAQQTTQPPTTTASAPTTAPPATEPPTTATAAPTTATTVTLTTP